MSGARRAFSLLEVMVAGVLALLVLSLIVQVMIPMGKGTVRGSQQVELQQVCTLAMNRLAQDLGAAPVEALTLVPTPLILGIHRIESVNLEAGQVWSGGLVVWWFDDANDQLWRREWDGSNPDVGRAPVTTDMFLPTAAELQQIAGAPRLAKVMAGNVREFEVDLVAQPPRLRLALQAPAPDGKAPERFELTRRVYLRNERY